MQEDVDQFMKQSGNGSVELVLKRFDEQYKKYKFLEANLVAKRKRYTFSGFFLQRMLLLCACSDIILQTEITNPRYRNNTQDCQIYEIKTGS